MYGILELHSKSLDELSTIARELGIKKAESMSKEDLVYKILDEQAVQSDEGADGKGDQNGACCAGSRG